MHDFNNLFNFCLFHAASVFHLISVIMMPKVSVIVLIHFPHINHGKKGKTIKLTKSFLLIALFPIKC